MMTELHAGVSPLTVTTATSRLNEGGLVISTDLGTITIPLNLTISGPSMGSEGTPVTYTSDLHGSNDGAVSYVWSVTLNNAPIGVANNTSSSFTFTPIEDGDYVVRLDVSDSHSPTPNTGFTTQSLSVSEPPINGSSANVAFGG